MRERRKGLFTKKGETELLQGGERKALLVVEGKGRLSQLTEKKATSGVPPRRGLLAKKKRGTHVS